jgi:hypothetical protein
MKYLLTAGIGMLIWALTPAMARAQITSPSNPSGYAPNMYNRAGQPLSPYLNLLRGGNNVADFADDPRDPSKVAPTGHAAGFNNTSNYFGTTSGQFFSRGAQQQRRR